VLKEALESGPRYHNLNYRENQQRNRYEEFLYCHQQRIRIHPFLKVLIDLL